MTPEAELSQELDEMIYLENLTSSETIDHQT